jgi:hypothetical protein
VTLKHRGRVVYLVGAQVAPVEAARIRRQAAKHKPPSIGSPAMKYAPNRERRRADKEGYAKLTVKRERLAQRKLAQTTRTDAKRPEMRR